MPLTSHTHHNAARSAPRQTSIFQEEARLGSATLGHGWEWCHGLIHGCKHPWPCPDVHGAHGNSQQQSSCLWAHILTTMQLDQPPARRWFARRPTSDQPLYDMDGSDAMALSMIVSIPALFQIYMEPMEAGNNCTQERRDPIQRRENVQKIIIYKKRSDVSLLIIASMQIVLICNRMWRLSET